MSYQDGWDALNLRMPPRVPRTEYSLESHWDVIRRVTGICGHGLGETMIQTEASNGGRTARRR
jgi:hypothetical protein